MVVQAMDVVDVVMPNQARQNRLRDFIIIVLLVVIVN
jgi:hypothetical protein